MENLEDIVTQKLALAEANFQALFRQCDMELTKALVEINTLRDLRAMPLVQLGQGGNLIEIMQPSESESKPAEEK